MKVLAAGRTVPMICARARARTYTRRQDQRQAETHSLPLLSLLSAAAPRLASESFGYLPTRKIEKHDDSHSASARRGASQRDRKRPSRAAGPATSVGVE